MSQQYSLQAIEEFISSFDDEFDPVHIENDVADILEHYGVSKTDGAKVGSGRYPLGSGETPYQRNVNFLSSVYKMREEGMSDTDIARGMGMTTTVFRSRISLANSEIRKENVARALELKDQGYSNVAIGEMMGINESSVRSLLNPALAERASIARTTANVLKDAVDNRAEHSGGAVGHR